MAVAFPWSSSARLLLIIPNSYSSLNNIKENTKGKSDKRSIIIMTASILLKNKTSRRRPRDKRRERKIESRMECRGLNGWIEVRALSGDSYRFVNGIYTLSQHTQQVSFKWVFALFWSKKWIYTYIVIRGLCWIFVRHNEAIILAI